MNKKVLVFAGTNEGREICEFLCENQIDTTACVATDYGRFCIENIAGLRILEGRLEQEEMQELMQGYDYMVDASHPYAQIVSENIIQAYMNCGNKNLKMIRILRESQEEKGKVFETVPEVCNFLNEHPGNVLLTTGSKDLPSFLEVKDYQERIFPRILPAMESLSCALSLGFKPSNIMCMQGPFSLEMNIAMIRDKDIRYMVSKDTGKSGGFQEKYEATKQTDIQLLTIGRPSKEEGLGLREGKQYFREVFQLQENEKQNGKRFPLFINIQGKKVLVVGAGGVGQRRIQSLLKFDCELHVLALQENPFADARISYVQGAFDETYLEGCYMVIAATDDRLTNEKIYQEGKKKNILVNVCDNPQQCDFYFPAIFQSQELIGGLVSKEGNQHGLVKNTAEAIRGIL